MSVSKSDAAVALRAIIPKVVGNVGKATISHALGLSHNHAKWNLRTAVTVTLLRSMFNVEKPELPISKVQKFTLKDPGVKGRIWVSRVSLPAPSEDAVREALIKAIEGLKEAGSTAGGYTMPELLPVECEWTGYRSAATKKSAEPRISEDAKYVEMMKEVSEPTTILYFHGGAHFMLDPCTHRRVTVQLAKLTGGRCLSVRYRLAPQNPFPAGLLDALVSYFELLYPPVNAVYTAVQPHHIVFAGDSAGGNLCFALLQTLLEIRRQGLKIVWNGEEREVPLPAGVAGNSPWLDITQSSLSCENGRFDFLPSRKAGSSIDYSKFPKDDIWPSNPPRNNMYAEDQLLCHPLVSPVAAKSWANSPPTQIIVGEECLTDEGLFVATKMAKQGVTVVLDQWEAMPHCFALVMERTVSAKKCYRRWARFMNAAVKQQQGAEPRGLETKGAWIKAKSNEEGSLDVYKASTITDEVVMKRMRDVVDWSNQKQVPLTLSKR